MAKRFTETTKWTQNTWYRKLPIELKLFWVYLLDTCDSVGVWEVDIEQAEFFLGESLKGIDRVIEELNKGKARVHEFQNGRKWWIVSFCDFQYSQLDEDSKSKPIQSYVRKLKEHDLWNLYLKGIDTLSKGYHKGLDTLKEKEKDKDKDKDKDKEKDKGYKKYKENLLTKLDLLRIAVSYKVKPSDVKEIWHDMKLYCGSNGKRYKDYNLALQAWVRRALKKKDIELDYSWKQTKHILEKMEKQNENNNNRSN